ncbi:hypothetical protein AX17_003387 [Amanita inopinata Kibby_2008]|nr:hypothetical protein AX17_003387 [Amanita inopinata Kibby_2008]
MLQDFDYTGTGSNSSQTLDLDTLSVQDNNKATDIYFGSHRSFEKFGTDILSSDMPALPLSASLTTSPSELREVQQLSLQEPPLEPQILSRSNTPDNEFLPDEPPSVLAYRIMRAQENPSPPPISQDSLTNKTTHYPLIDISAPSTPYEHSVINRRLPDDVRPLLLSPLWSSVDRPPPSRQGDMTPQQDLIEFDSCELPAPGTTRSPPSGHMADVHLLHKSPAAKSSPVLISFESPEKPEVLSHGLQASWSSPSERNAESRGWGRGHDRQKDNDQSSLTVSSPDRRDGKQVGGPLGTPIRRSARLSKIVTLHGSPLSLSTDNTVDVSGPHARMATQEDTTQARVKRKNGKRLTSPESPNKQSRRNKHEQDGGSANAGATKEAQSETKVMLGNMAEALGSLSLASSNVLTQLPTSPLNERFRPFDALTSTSPIRSVSSSKVPQTPSASKELTTSTSPSRLTTGDPVSKSASPLPMTVDPTRTPARRILVEDAIAQGYRFPKTNTRLTTIASSSGLVLPRTPVLYIPSTDSPARRVLITETSTIGAPFPSLKASIVQSPSRQRYDRSQSAEPVSIKAASRNSQTRSNSAEPSSIARGVSTYFRPPSNMTSTNTKLGRLPFPLTVAVIQEETYITDKLEPTVNHSDLGSIPSSSLKQRTSRIPRIGGKPYIRKGAGSKPINKDEVSGVTSTIDPHASININRPSQSKLDVHRSDTHDKTRIPRPGVTSLSHKPAVKPLIGLKRKRSTEQAVASTSTVVPRSLSRGVPSMAAKSASTRKITSLRENPTLPPLRTYTSLDMQAQQNPVDTCPSTEKLEESIPLAPSVEGQLHALPIHSTAVDTEAAPVSHVLLVQSSKSDAPNLPARRETRARKRIQGTTDAVRPLQSRRKANKAPAPLYQDDVFSGMTAVALKALTNSNTVRNQQYVAAKLETELIRKAGFRPESPTVKTRTVLQRTQEEKCRERRERAHRRAQRTDVTMHHNECSGARDAAGNAFGLPAAVMVDQDVDENVSDDPDGKPHRRGAGDEGEYMTPEKSERSGEATKKNKEERQVKWDKSLFTTVYLNEVELGARPLSKDAVTLKGCLAPTSKTIQLDTLGNLASTNTPLTELIQENIVVKKFIYDDDEEVTQEVTPPISVPKGTRSRAKRSKS